MRNALTSVIAARFSFYVTRQDPKAPLRPSALLSLVSGPLSGGARYLVLRGGCWEEGLALRG